ncbi:hypothetical protein [Pseudomonas protegens]|uniref:hypothetical protein n=1 Tax=Pseudomonas protegens TaxID=380021 RepID=UPI0015E8971F|nr:hypothetical protein [Pseudomonas protegens]
MLVNSGMSESKALILDKACLDEQEVVLLKMFRAISAQQQKDVLRILEAFIQMLE